VQCTISLVIRCARAGIETKKHPMALDMGQAMHEKFAFNHSTYDKKTYDNL